MSRRGAPLGAWLLTGWLVLAGPTAAEDPTQDRARALEILERAAAALKAVSSVRYSARIEPRGIGEKFWPQAEGVAVLSGWDGALRRPAKFYFDLETRRAGAARSARITGGGNGESFFVIDHANRRSYSDMDPLVLGSHGQTLARFEMAEFVQENPLADEIHAREVSFVGTKPFAGRDCYEIQVRYSGGRGEATWLFSTEDLLPRWRLQSFSIPQGEGALEFTILELAVDPAVTPELFELQLPPGYEEIDDFSP